MPALHSSSGDAINDRLIAALVFSQENFDGSQTFEFNPDQLPAFSYPSNLI
jgi:hypothetical protein